MMSFFPLKTDQNLAPDQMLVTFESDFRTQYFTVHLEFSIQPISNAGFF